MLSPLYWLKNLQDITLRKIVPNKIGENLEFRILPGGFVGLRRE